MISDQTLRATFFVITFSTIAGVVLGAVAMGLIWEDAVIKRGYALHCPDTGNFAWKGECDG